MGQEVSAGGSWIKAIWCVQRDLADALVSALQTPGSRLEQVHQLQQCQACLSSTLLQDPDVQRVCLQPPRMCPMAGVDAIRRPSSSQCTISSHAPMISALRPCCADPPTGQPHQLPPVMESMVCPSSSARSCEIETTEPADPARWGSCSASVMAVWLSSRASGPSSCSVLTKV